MFVACVEEKIVGFVHFQPVYQDQRWHAVALGTETGVYDASPVEDELLRHAVTAAGLRGVKRLYARIQSGTDLVNSFERVGFAPFATETIFVAETYISEGRSAPIRAQDTTDTWAIHQLYNATAPRQVQYAEALTSHRWDLSDPGVSDGYVQTFRLACRRWSGIGRLRPCVVRPRGASSGIALLAGPNGFARRFA